MTTEFLIARLGNLPLGEAWSEAHRAAEVALAADRASAEAKQHPREIVPVTLATQNQFVQLTGSWPAIGYGDLALEAHGRCVRTHEELAAALRSGCLDDIAHAAARQVGPADELETHGAAAARAGDFAVKRFKLGCAAQIAATDGHPLADAARALLACEDLEHRLEAARQRHEQHAALELERVQAEQRAVARAIVDKTVERVRAAQAAATDLRAKAALAEREYHQLRAAALVERLRASGLLELRVGGLGERARALYAVDDLVRTAPEMSLAQIGVLEAVLAAHEAAR